MADNDTATRAAIDAVRPPTGSGPAAWGRYAVGVGSVMAALGLGGDKLAMQPNRVETAIAAAVKAERDNANADKAIMREKYGEELDAVRREGKEIRDRMAGAIDKCHDNALKERDGFQHALIAMAQQMSR